jgi:hypothetical protein
MSSHNYSLWLDEGHGAVGEFAPDDHNDFCPGVITIALGKNPNISYGGGVKIFLRKEADIKSVAKAFRDIAEGIEREMLPPPMPEDLVGLGANIPLGVVDCE